jgi:hypothetical protein
MGMPQNNNDHWGIRRIQAITAISLALFLPAIAPIFFLELSSLAIGTWGIAAGWGSFWVAVQAARPDWRCALPQPLRAVFFRTLEHPWKETRRAGDYVEQYCERCQQYRHGIMTAYDSVEEWREGRIQIDSLPGASVPSL